MSDVTVMFSLSLAMRITHSFFVIYMDYTHMTRTSQWRGEYRLSSERGRGIEGQKNMIKEYDLKGDNLISAGYPLFLDLL